MLHSLGGCLKHIISVKISSLRRCNLKANKTFGSIILRVCIIQHFDRV